MASHDDVSKLIKAFVSQKARAVTISQRVVIHPWVMDAQIIHATDTAAQWYGLAQSTDLVGLWQSYLQHPQDFPLSRAMAVCRHAGYTEVPTEYVLRIRQGDRARFRAVRKQTTQVDVDGETYWITVLGEPHGSLLADTLDLTTLPLPDTDEARQFGSTSVSVQEMEALLRDVWTADSPPSRPLPSLLTPGPRLHWRQEGHWHAPTRPTAAQTAQRLGQTLQHARRAQHLSLRTLAQRCMQLVGHQVTPQHLSNLERGYRLPSLRLLQALGTVLALDSAVLVATVLSPTIALSPDSQTELPMAQIPGDMLTYVQQAGQQMVHAKHAYRMALCAAHQAGYSLRQLAAVTGLSSSRIQQLIATAPYASASPTTAHAPGRT